MFAFHVMETEMLVFTIQCENGVVCYHKIQTNKQTCLVQLYVRFELFTEKLQRKYLIGSHLGTESTEIPRGKG